MQSRSATDPRRFAIVRLRVAACLAALLLAPAAASCGKAPPGRPAGGAEKLSGLCFSPYVRGSPAGDDTIGRGTIARLLEVIAPHTRGIRTFTSLGSGLESARLARKAGLVVAAGCNIESDAGANEAQVEGLMDLCRSGYADLAVVGEETLYFGFADEAALLGYMRRLKTTGVKVTTSETWGELIGHPAVIAECDVLLANMFPYWEKVPVSKAVEYLDSCYRKLRNKSRGKKIVVETGWPTAGETRGEAVAGPENARAFLEGFRSWARANGVEYYYFEAFDEPWKARSEGAVGAHWGIWRSDGRLKPYLRGR